MAEDEFAKEIEGGLEGALQAMTDLQSRLESGEQIEEKELTMLARMVANQMEAVRAQLEAALGPIDPEEIKSQMKAQLSPQEYQEWLDGEEERIKFRDEFAKEQTLREQLGEG